MEVFEKARVSGLTRGLDGFEYTSAETFELEFGRIWSRNWFCVGRAASIEEPGSFLLATIGPESLIIVRDEGGVIRAHFNVCRHRGTVLCEETRGRFAGTIQCPYHAWTYGLDGRLLGARSMREIDEFDMADYPLKSATAVEWNGFIFINLQKDADSFSADFGPIYERFAEWDIGGLRQGGRIEYDVRANWKLLFENFSECYHCPVVHPQLAAVSPWDSGRNDLMSGGFLGGYMRLSRETMSTDGARRRPALVGLTKPNTERVYYYTIMPNMFVTLAPDYVMAHLLNPRAPDRTRITCEWFFEPRTIAAPDFDPGDVISFWDQTNRQDWHLCEMTQRGVSSAAFEPGPYAHCEGLLLAFDQHYRELMGE